MEEPQVAEQVLEEEEIDARLTEFLSDHDTSWAEADTVAGVVEQYNPLDMELVRCSSWHSVWYLTLFV